MPTQDEIDAKFRASVRDAEATWNRLSPEQQTVVNERMEHLRDSGRRIIHDHYRSGMPPDIGGSAEAS